MAAERTRIVRIQMTTLTQAQLQLIKELGLTANSPRKEPGVAALLSFLWTGAGHLYCGRLGLGVVLAIVYLFSFFLWILVLPALASFGMWIWGMFAAAKEARLVNEAIDALQSLDEEAQREEQAESQSLLEQKVSAEQFRESLRKLAFLKEQGIYSDEEAEGRVRQCIYELQSKELGDQKEDYLMVAGEMRQAGVVSDSQLASLKALLR